MNRRIEGRKINRSANRKNGITPIHFFQLNPRTGFLGEVWSMGWVIFQLPPNLSLSETPPYGRVSLYPTDLFILQP
jgi:hypothetical protein